MAAARPDTWMPLYWGDYAKDTAHLSAAQHGAYLMLIKHYWVTGKPLVDDDAVLWRIACADSKNHWKKMRSVVVSFFVQQNGKLGHSRIDEELEKAAKFLEKQAENGKKGGRPAKPVETGGKPTANPTAKPEETTSQSQSPKKDPPPASQVPPKGGELELPGMGKAPRSERGTKIDPGWKPSEDLRQFARSLGLDADAVTAEFVDYWKGIPGAKGRKSDWPGTFRNRCRAKAEYRGTPHKNGREPMQI